MDSLTNSNQLVKTFCVLDDLSVQLFEKTNLGRPNSLSRSEIATIILMKNAFGINCLKKLYRLLQINYANEFHLPVYKNFVVTMNRYSLDFLALVNILLQLQNKRSGVVKIIDSTPLPVCKNIRIYAHKVMKRIATRSKTTTGWFYGLKLHIITDLKKNMLMMRFTTGRVDDRVVLDEFLDKFSNSMILADAGYISPKLQQKAIQRRNVMLTGIRKNMNKLTTPLQIFLLNMRGGIESVFSVLKERLGLISSLPRSENGYLAHYSRALFGYLFQPLIS
ncbi:hypothetical protein A3F03_04000 [Candidatus Roizmanbacteria bacterium RIFCSPHIGHO2_12_FULL_41_11]|uniref:Transposase DDE domain-containing protein n=2 Tax=Candidatus Roizmaniibacteriota TaxID=1752723 RepID=A0A1F7J8L9_9BACT|nr:MAG: hypothetical protein A3F03_04000 [Candidatus Roizmanbacteria bacterium RIFCSPHIGHO2_12_FULL_41_11]OGK51967.1 MAG: hypothetical protein A2966_04140 [Candidatus Roizmanbacteria bacterium RIFCSPLOWO2_01_FULL_41_22]